MPLQSTLHWGPIRAGSHVLLYVSVHRLQITALKVYWNRSFKTKPRFEKLLAKSVEDLNGKKKKSLCFIQTTHHFCNNLSPEMRQCEPTHPRTSSQVEQQGRMFSLQSSLQNFYSTRQVSLISIRAQWAVCQPKYLHCSEDSSWERETCFCWVTWATMLCQLVSGYKCSVTACLQAKARTRPLVSQTTQPKIRFQASSLTNISS